MDHYCHLIRTCVFKDNETGICKASPLSKCKYRKNFPVQKPDENYIPPASTKKSTGELRSKDYLEGFRDGVLAVKTITKVKIKLKKKEDDK